VLDYGASGLVETLDTLRGAGLKTSGAGRSRAEAGWPTVVEVATDCRVVVYGFGTETSGIPASWAALQDCPGVNFLADLSDETAAAIGASIREIKRQQDITLASIHWGSNWGYEVPREHVRFAHGLIDNGVDIVHGHSSHHPRPIEVYRNRLILYGCGDLINDYEGIGGYEQYRADLVLMYFATLNPANGNLIQLRMTPMRIRKMRLNRAAPADVRWLTDRLARVSRGFGTWVDEAEDGGLLLRW
jgi:poly-gamma-glutamate synthesis protein (capsule biosynthesis protein)